MTCVQDCQREAELEKRIAELEEALRSNTAQQQFGIQQGDYRHFNFTEYLAEWMIRNGFATGHGDNFVSLLDELEWQVDEIRSRAG